MKLLRLGIVRRRLTFFAAAAAIAVLAGTALADAPDVKIAPVQSPAITATAVTNADGTVTVTVRGGWNWEHNNADCNLDRAGAGVAIDWFDPKQPGNDLGVSIPINGVSTPIAVGTAAANTLNPAHTAAPPPENATGAGSVVDISDRSQFASWRGGCGVFSSTTNIAGSAEVMSHGNL